jgi:hypothetical protein
VAAKGGRSRPGLPIFRVFRRGRGSCAWVACAGLGAVTACGGSTRDVVPVSRDVVTDNPAPGRGDQGYEYVARRPLAVVALAEARGVEPLTARAAIDRLADRLDACVTEEGRKGAPVEGAARVVAQIGATGEVTGTSVRIDPSTSGASSAVLCLVAPTKLLAFPPGTADGRGIAIEAIWGRVVPGPAP